MADELLYEPVKIWIEEVLRERDSEFDDIPDSVWARLLENKYIKWHLKKAAKRNDKSLDFVLAAVVGGLQMLRKRPEQPYSKKTAQQGYDLLIRFVRQEIIFQYALWQGFARLGDSGIEVVCSFDVEWHARWMLSTVDLEQIRQAWNEQRPDDQFKSVRAFKERCDRALKALPQSELSKFVQQAIHPDTVTIPQHRTIIALTDCLP